jgi:hypothetical protein
VVIVTVSAPKVSVEPSTTVYVYVDM